MCIGGVVNVASEWNGIESKTVKPRGKRALMLMEGG